MSLTTQQWRYVGASSYGTASVAAALDALYTLGTAVTYADGSGRTPGAGSAWTWSRFQIAGPVTEAVYAAPPTDTLNQRIVLAGSTTAKTPAMLSPDTWSTNMILSGINKNSGAFASWDHATAPFTSGQFSGYSRAWTTAAGTGSVYLYECQESVLIVFGNAYAVLLGAFLDPESADALDAESDGKLYGMSTSGTTAAWVNTWWAMSSTSGFLRQAVANGNCHAGCFVPAASTWTTIESVMAANTAMSGTGLKTRGGRWARVALGMRKSTAAPNDEFVGRLREVFMFADQQFPVKQSNGGATIGYCVSASSSAQADCLFLLH